MLLLWGASTGGPAPTIVGTPTWTDNGDGTATVTWETDINCYSGLDYGASSGVYTGSAMSYNTPGDSGSGLKFGTSHEAIVPEVGTIADGTWYYRIAGGNSGYNSQGYIDIERTGEITTGAQYQLPTGAYINASSSIQYQTPYGYVNG